MQMPQNMSLFTLNFFKKHSFVCGGGTQVRTLVFGEVRRVSLHHMNCGDPV